MQVKDVFVASCFLTLMYRLIGNLGDVTKVIITFVLWYKNI